MSDDPSVLVFNPLPWDRTVSGTVPAHCLRPRGLPTDETSGRHYQDREADRHSLTAAYPADGEDLPLGAQGRYLPETTVPGMGFAVVDGDDLSDPATWPSDGRAVVETDRYRIAFDRERGGIASWYDAERDCEWVDRDADWPLAGFVHETVADRDHDRPRQLLFEYPPEVDDWHAAVSGLLDADRGFRRVHAERTGATGVRSHLVYETPDGYHVVQRLDAPGVPGEVELSVVVPAAGDTVVVEANWRMGLETRPEATYLAFPFAIDEPTARIDVGGQAVEPGADQLPGSCHDYYTVQRWAALSNADRGMTVGCPLNPLVQFGGFRFGEAARSVALDDALLLGWVTNNYWDTNFRAHQPGRVRARYHLTPAGAFDEARAHRLGLAAEHAAPVAQTTGEPPAEPPVPAGESLLDLPAPPVLVLQVRPAAAEPSRLAPGVDPEPTDDVLVLLRNASDEAREAVLDANVAAIAGARTVDLLAGDRTLESLAVEERGVAVPLAARETAQVRLSFVQG